MSEGLAIRPLDLAQVETLIDWAREEGWSPGLKDGACFLAADPHGFFGAFAKDQLIGGIAAVRYGPRFGFIGLLIVHPEFRGGRAGPELAQAAIGHLGERIIGEDGVLAKEKHYHHIYGFETAHRQLRYLGKAGSLQSGPIAPLEAATELVDARKLPAGVLNAFDGLYFPGPRAAFLRQWIHAQGHQAIGCLQGHPVKTLVGYGVIRSTPLGHKIGPLFAKNQAIARAILAKLVEGLAPGDPVIWDIPAPNGLAVRLAKDAGMEVVFETARMYKNGAVSIRPETVYGITSFELG